MPVVTHATSALGPASLAEEDQAKALIKCLAPSSAISLIMSECPSPHSIISSALRAWPMAVSATNRSSSCFDCASVDRSSAGGSGTVRSSLMRASAKRASQSHRSTEPSHCHSLFFVVLHFSSFFNGIHPSQTFKSYRPNARFVSTPVIENSEPNFRFGCAPWKGGAFQWVQVPPGDRSSRKQPEQAWR